MRFTVAQLQDFWAAARRAGPLLIVGGGRWGRVWAGVAAAARGGAHGVAILSRQHAPDVRQWAASASGLTGLVVCDELGCAVQAIGRPSIAIIASRPSCHVRDATEALAAGAHVLVEKPLSDDIAAGRALLRDAAARKRILGIGTEFAFLPALHHLAKAIGSTDPRDDMAGIADIRIEWSDPANEVRHGSPKRLHPEIGLLDDLLPHMFSILRVLLPEAALNIVSARVDASGEGRMVLTDGAGRRCECLCSNTAMQRKRMVHIAGAGRVATLDFGSARPLVTVQGQPVAVPETLSALDSTLRLELGAFNLLVHSPDAVSPLTRGVAPLLDLHDQLSACLARAAY